MSDEPSFAEKIKGLQFAPGGIPKDRQVRESRGESGERLKHTVDTDGTSSVTHTEHADSDRVDATVAPATVAMQIATPSVAQAAQITVTPPEEQ